MAILDLNTIEQLHGRIQMCRVCWEAEQASLLKAKIENHTWVKKTSTKKLQTAIDEVVFMLPQYLLEYTFSNSFIRALTHKKKKNTSGYVHLWTHLYWIYNHRCSECEDTHSIGWVSVLVSRLDVNAHAHVAIRFRDSVSDPEFDKWGTLF